jgi:hypothetical protein
MTALALAHSNEPTFDGWRVIVTPGQHLARRVWLAKDGVLRLLLWETDADYPRVFAFTRMAEKAVARVLAGAQHKEPA